MFLSKAWTFGSSLPGAYEEYFSEGAKSFFLIYFQVENSHFGRPKTNFNFSKIFPVKNIRTPTPVMPLLFAMIWLALIHNYSNLHKCDWLQIDTEHPQNGSGKLEFTCVCKWMQNCKINSLHLTWKWGMGTNVLPFKPPLHTQDWPMTIHKIPQCISAFFSSQEQDTTFSPNAGFRLTCRLPHWWWYLFNCASATCRRGMTKRQAAASQ